MKRLNLDHLKELVRQKGGKCVSLVYLGMDKRHEWECANGHRWKAKPSNIKSGQWCPTCYSFSTRSTLGEMHQLAHSMRGRCLSTIYIPKAKLTWECEQGHIFTADPSQVKNKHWCPTCGGNRPHGIEAMQRLAQEKGGVCLSVEYKNSKALLLWRCSNKHEWESQPATIIRGVWCPYCSGSRKTEAEVLGEARALANVKGGECLSNSYTNNYSPMLWKCSKAHEWMASLSNIRKPSWCPYCKENRSEKACRELFEKLFRTPFPKVHPKWLRKVKGRGIGMELDGYSEKLRLAFEYQGIQHYKWSPWIQKTLKDFKAQQQRDQEKRELCKANGVLLIEVPWHTKDLSAFVKDVRNYV